MERRNFLKQLSISPIMMSGAVFAHETPSANVVRLRRTGSRWSLSNGLIYRSLSIEKMALRAQSLRNVRTGYEWAVPNAASELVLAFAGQSWEGIGPEASFTTTHTSSRKLSSGAVEVKIELLQRSSGVKVHTFQTCFPDVSVIEHWCRVENTGTNPISNLNRFDPFCMRLQGGAGPLRIHTIDRKGYSLQQTELGQTFEATGGDWNSPQHAGWVVIENVRAKEFLFLGIEWEREWSVRLERHGKEIKVTAGLLNSAHSLLPGRGIDSPRVFFGTAHGELDDSSRETHDYLRRYVLPSALPDTPWVIYHVYSTGPENMEEIILKELDHAVWLGADVFHHDASWYLGSSTKRTGDWGSGLGNYVEHPQKFPHGLSLIAQEVHRRGLKFGLWVDPIVVDSRIVGKRIKREWLASWDGRENILIINNWAAPVNQLCVGNPEVKEYLIEELSSLIERCGVDWLKWDNSALSARPYCNNTQHGHQESDGSYRNVLNIYEIWAYLHHRFPTLVLEQCGYGSRLDYGLARYARANWLTDALAGGRSNVAPLARNTLLTAAYVFPSSYNLSGVAKGPEIDSPTTPARLDAIFRSRMMGHFRVATPTGIISDRFSQWPKEVREAARRNVRTFKKYRHLLSQDTYHLLPASEGRMWTMTQFCAGDGSEAVLLCFRGADPKGTVILKPKGLASSGTYQITSYNTGLKSTVTAKGLERDGLLIDLPEGETSEILHLLRRN